MVNMFPFANRFTFLFESHILHRCYQLESLFFIQHKKNVKLKPSHSLSQVAAQRRVRKANNYFLPPALKVRKVIKFKPNLVGTRFIDLACLSSQLEKMLNHAATCDSCRLVALDIGKSIVLHDETSREGLASVLSASCVGCNQTFQINTSQKIKSLSGNVRWQINLTSVWGQVASGGGCSKMNEFLGTAGVPGMHSATFSAIEEQIGLWWGIILEQHVVEAAAVEKEIAIWKSHFKMVGRVKVPWITVIIDGGWSKKSTNTLILPCLG